MATPLSLVTTVHDHCSKSACSATRSIKHSWSAPVRHQCSILYRWHCLRLADWQVDCGKVANFYSHHGRSDYLGPECSCRIFYFARRLHWHPMVSRSRQTLHWSPGKLRGVQLGRIVGLSLLASYIRSEHCEKNVLSIDKIIYRQRLCHWLGCNGRRTLH